MLDNMVVVEVINKQFSKEKCFMYLFWCFWIVVVIYVVQLGYFESFIQYLGCWNFNVLYRYIRI